MIFTIKSAVVVGLEGIPIVIELSAGNGMPGIYIVGLPNATIREAKSRLRVALKQSGVSLPSKKFIFNLLPANLKKEGSHLDLSFAVILLKACMQEVIGNDDWGYLGELSLSGHVKGFASAFALVEALVETGCKTIVISSECLYVSESFQEIEFISITHITELLKEPVLLSSIAQKSSPHQQVSFAQTKHYNIAWADQPEYCLDDVYGHEVIKRALLLAVAGGHHTLMIGPPGTGKSMLAKCLVGLLPPLTVQERMELLKIHSYGEQFQTIGTIQLRPFRAPHASVTAAGMFGGRQISSIGEVTLAHRGILFLDELPEYKRDVIEGLRDAMESGTVSVSKAGHKYDWPANFLLIATANPCPCGYRGYSDQCQCHEGVVHRYFSKVSGPILDRMDIKIDVSLKTTTYQHFLKPLDGSQSAVRVSHEVMKQSVIEVRKIQRKRFGNDTMLNGKMTPKEIEQHCSLDDAGEAFLSKIYSASKDSIRSFHKLIKLARTIADLEGRVDIGISHLTEAYYYNRRQMD